MVRRGTAAPTRQHSAHRIRVGRLSTAVLAGALLAGLLGVPAAGASLPMQNPPAPRVLLIGIGDLSWADVSGQTTPTLWSLAGTGAAGSMTARTGPHPTCADLGWLTISAGTRVRATPDPSGCGSAPAPVPAGPISVVPGWSAYAATASQDGARIGLLGDALGGDGVCATAVGPGAGLALADNEGHVDRYLPNPAQLDTTVMSQCPVTAVDLSGVLDTTRPRSAALRALDAEVGRLVALAPAGTSVLITGVDDTDRDQPPSPPAVLTRLHVALAIGPDSTGARFGHELLTSDSTRWPGLLRLPDITASLLTFLNVARPAALTGNPWATAGALPAGSAATVRQLDDTAVAARTLRDLTPGAAILIAVLLAVLAIAGYGLVRPGRRRRGRLRTLGTRRPGLQPVPARAVQLVGLTVAAVPLAAHLAQLSGWWHADDPTLTLAAWTAGLAAGLAVLALLAGLARPGAGPYTGVGLLAGMTVLFLEGDMLLGGPLQRLSLYGLSPLDRGHSYGAGNVTTGTVLAATLVLSVVLACEVLSRGGSPTAAAGAVAGFGTVVAVAHTWPTGGSDAGGAAALFLGVLVVTLWLLGVRARATHLAYVAALSVGALAVFTALDLLQPPGQRTALGTFFAALGSGQAGDLLHTRAEVVGTNLASAPLLIGGPILLLGLGVLQLWGHHFTAWRRACQLCNHLPVLVAAMLTAGTAELLGNASGVVVVCAAFALALPLAVAVLAEARARELSAPALAPAPSGPGNHPRPAWAQS